MSRTTVRCVTSGRKSGEYEVVFDREGLVVSVTRLMPYGRTRRTFHYAQKGPMGLTAACAVRAAKRKLKDDTAALAN